MPAPYKHEQPPFRDKESWKKIGNCVMFLAGSFFLLFWLFNGPLRPDPTKATRGRTTVTIEAPAEAVQQLSPFADWMLHSGFLYLGIPLLGFAFYNQVRWRRQTEAKELIARDERTANNRLAASPINQLGGRRNDAKKKPDIEVEVNGKKMKIPAMRCDVGTLILPGDRRFANLSFDKVIGQQEAKFEITEFLDFLKHPEKYQKLECKVPRGVLMHGTHGVGKTMLARTLAALCGLPVIEVGGSEFVEMFVGVGASRMRLLFEDLDNLVTVFGGAILFIDEFDAVARIRGSSHNTESDTTLNQLLKEMDGIVARPNVYTFAATNRKDNIDPAAIRPGRFDREVQFFNPTRKDREALLGIYLPESLRAPGLDLSVAAKACPGASGAHCANIVNEAKILTVRARLDRVTQDILDEAVLKVMMGARREGQRQILTPMELDTVKVHEAGHALVYMKLAGRAPLRFTIIPRGQSGGHVAYSDDFETLITKEHCKIRLAVLMGGAASTAKLRDGQEDSGIGMDIQMASDLAIQMVTQFGMSALGKFNLQSMQKAGLVSDQFRDRVAKAVQDLVDEGEATARRIVDEHTEDLRHLVVAIEEHETLLEPDFKRIFKLSYEDGTGTSPAPKAASEKEGGENA